MYISSAFKYQHEWWRYLIGLLVIFIFSQLGSLPFLVAAALKVTEEGGSFDDLSDTDKLMTILSSNTTLFLMLLSFAVGLLGIYLIVKYLHRQPMKALTTTRKRVDWGRFFFGFLLITVFTLVATGIDFYLNPDNYEVQFNLKPFLVLLFIVIIFIPLQTSFEEYLFRGYLMQGIGVLVKNKWFPLLSTSLIFGLMHFANPEVDKLGSVIMVYYIGTGLFLGIITLMDDGLELALGFHAGNNAIAALLVTADWTVFTTNSVLKDLSEPTAGFDILIPIFVIYPIFLFVMAKRYKWNNWKVKLFGSVEKPIEKALTEN